jgi:ParB family chromosome partitioning protein
MVEAGELTFGHGRALLALDSTEAMVAAAAKVKALAMSVRQTETYVQRLMNPEAKPGKLEKIAAAVKAQDPNVREAQEMLQRRLGLRVRIEDKKGKGKVIIEYSGVEDFDAILEGLGVSCQGLAESRGRHG